jgi:hypothetical protein
MRSHKQNFVADIAALKGQLSEVLAMLAALANAARESETASFTLKKFLARNSCRRANITNCDAKDAARA